MGILGNYSILHKSPGRYLSGTVASGDRENFNRAGAFRSRFVGSGGYGIPKFSAVPNGYVHPYSWAMAQVSGGLASYRQLSADLSTSDAALALGLGLDSALSASVVLTNAPLALIVALEAALSAGITLTDAQLAVILLLEAALSATGDLTSADLGNILGLTAALSASISSSAGVVNLVNLSADITSTTALSPESLASQILDNNDIETGYSMREALRLILAAVAGKLSGASGVTVTIRDVNDLKDRIIATVDSYGNRTGVTHDKTE